MPLNCRNNRNCRNADSSAVQDLASLPVIRLLKEPVASLSELYNRYPKGEFGWIALVLNERTFAFWDIETERWALISGGSGSSGGVTSHTSLTNKNGDANFQHITSEQKSALANLINSGGSDRGIIDLGGGQPPGFPNSIIEPNVYLYGMSTRRGILIVSRSTVGSGQPFTVRQIMIEAGVVRERKGTTVNDQLTAEWTERPNLLSDNGGSGVTASALSIPEIRVSENNNVFFNESAGAGNRLFLEPFDLPDNIARLNPHIVARRARFIWGRNKVAKHTGQLGANKTKWCDVLVPNNSVYSRQRPLVRPLAIPLHPNTARAGGFLRFPNGQHGNIDTAQSLCEVFTHIRHNAGARIYTAALNANRSFNSSLFTHVRAGQAKQLHGTLGFCLRIDNPDFTRVAPNDWKGQNYQHIPRYLYGNVCRMFVTVRIQNNGNPSRDRISYSLKPQR